METKLSKIVYKKRTFVKEGAITSVFNGQDKSGGKAFVSLRPGKVRETCNGQGKIVHSCSKSRKKCNILSSRKYLIV